MSDKTLITEELAERIHGIVHGACVSVVEALSEAGVSYAKHMYRLQTAEPHIEAMVRGYCDNEVREFNEFVAKYEEPHV